MATSKKRTDEDAPYRGVLRTALDGCWIADASGRLLDVNDAYCRMSGYSREELLDLTIGRLEAVETPREVVEHIQGLAERGADRFESLHRRKDGSVYPVEVSIQYLPHPRARCFTFIRDLSEAKRAEQALRESEERFQLFMDHFPGLAYIKDERSRVLFASRGFLRYLGMAPEAVVGRTNAELFPPGFAEGMTADDQRVIASGESAELEETFGGRVWATHKFPIPRLGAPPLLAGLTVDITARREAERALNEKTLELEKLFEASLDLLCIADSRGYYRRLNPEWERTLGFRREELEGRHFAEFVHPDDMPAAEAAVAALAAHKPMIDFQNRYRCKDGSYRWLEWRAFFSGELAYAAARDITARRETEEALRKNARLLLEAQRIAHLGAYDLDVPAGTWTSSAVLDEIFGVPETGYPRDVAGWLRIIHPDDREEMESYLTHAVLGARQGFDKEYRILRVSDGEERRVHGRGQLFFDREGRPIRMVGTIQDITERRRAEEEKLHLERRLLHAQKLESLGVLAGGIAHDFNNLLMSILGNLEMARLTLPREAPAWSSIEQAVGGVRRSADLTRQMLAYAGRAPFVIGALDLSALVRQNAELLRTTVSRSISLDLALAPDLPAIQADAAQTQQVIMNLITNASEAIGDEPGRVTLTTGVAELDAEQLAQSRVGEAPPAGRYVFVEVADTGIGMDDETRRRLFEPFFTTKFQGRGLGMAAVSGIVRGHGGALFLRTAPGRGTAIQVLFPVPGDSGRRPAAGPAAPATAAQPHPAKLRGTVLVVEDEAAVRGVVRDLLEHLGLSVMTASDGEEGVRVFGEHAAELDCVLLDLSMPRMDGLAALREITRIKPGIRVILASGFARQEALQRFSGQGLAAFIQKPYGTAELRATFAAVLTPADGGK